MNGQAFHFSIWRDWNYLLPIQGSMWRSDVVEEGGDRVWTANDVFVTESFLWCEHVQTKSRSYTPPRHPGWHVHQQPAACKDVVQDSKAKAHCIRRITCDWHCCIWPWEFPPFTTWGMASATAPSRVSWAIGCYSSTSDSHPLTEAWMMLPMMKHAQPHFFGL